jgi:hypothetical protein
MNSRSSFHPSVMQDVSIIAALFYAALLALL